MITVTGDFIVSTGLKTTNPTIEIILSLQDSSTVSIFGKINNLGSTVWNIDYRNISVETLPEASELLTNSFEIVFDRCEKYLISQVLIDQPTLTLEQE